MEHSQFGSVNLLIFLFNPSVLEFKNEIENKNTTWIQCLQIHLYNALFCYVIPLLRSVSHETGTQDPEPSTSIPWCWSRQSRRGDSCAPSRMTETAAASVSCFEYKLPSFAPQPCQLGPSRSLLFRLPLRHPPASGPAVAAAAEGRGGRGRRKGGGGRGGGRSRCGGAGWGLWWWGVAWPLVSLALVPVQALLMAGTRPSFSLFLSPSFPFKACVRLQTLRFLSLESLVSASASV